MVWEHRESDMFLAMEGSNGLGAKTVLTYSLQ